MKKRALITGITGQDGSYLAELLLSKNYEVHGLVRRTSLCNLGRIKHISHKLNVHVGDITDRASIDFIIRTYKPDEVYNLAAQSHVGTSFKTPESTCQITGIGCLNVIDSLRVNNPEGKFYQASTSELFGDVRETPQKETTQFYPRSPYGCAKLFSYWITKNYREAYNMFACNGILFNHGSPRRGDNFVEQKIVKGLHKIFKNGESGPLLLGNLNAKRDIGHAEDYVNAQWLMLQQESPEDYVIATGKQHSIREIVETACKCFNRTIEWSGEGLNEVGKVSGVTVIAVSCEFFRPSEVETLLGDPSKAEKELGWVRNYDFESLIRDMCLQTTVT